MSLFYKQPPTEGIFRSDDNAFIVDELQTGGVSEDLRDLWQYAALSYKVYGRRDKDISVPEWARWEGEVQPTVPRPWYSFDIGGLRSEVWIRRDEEAVIGAAVVYRGTVSLRDFYSNFDWLTRYNPFVRNLYKQVRGRIDPIVSGLQAQFGDSLPIVTTGHSLGGGLAQQAAYACGAIRHVYAFDPSPVTGYWSIPKTDREKNAQGLTICRVYEQGEILAYLRLVTKAIARVRCVPNRNPRIIEIRFNFDKGNSIKEHSMYTLATNLKP